MGHDVERVEVVPFDAADSAIGDIGAEVEKTPPLCVETSVAVGAVPAVMVEAQVGEMRERDELCGGIQAATQERDTVTEQARVVLEDLQGMDFFSVFSFGRNRRTTMPTSTSSFFLFAGSHDQVATLREELTRAESLKEEAQATTASLSVDVTNGRAAIANLNANVGTLRDELAGRLAAHLVLDDFRTTPSTDTNQLVGQLIIVVDGAREVVKESLRLGVQRSFAIVRSHYANIDLRELSQGFPSGYTDAKLDAIEEEVAPFIRALSDQMEGEIAED
ncbi:hypothetical protein PVAP13_8KG224303, partial [Panicum virgatum]